MRRTTRALAVAALTAAAFATAPQAHAKPAAQSGPGPARTGGTVTVSASCDTVVGAVPGPVDASPPALDETAAGGACTADRGGKDEGAWDEAGGGCAGLQPCDSAKPPEPASPDCTGAQPCAGGTIPGVPDDGGKTKGGSDSGKSDGGLGESGKTEGGSSGRGNTPGGGDDTGKTEGGSSGRGDTRGSGDGTGKTDGGWDGSGQTDGGWDGSGQTDGGWEAGGQTDGGWDAGGHDCAEPAGDPSCAPPTIGHGVNAGEGGAFAGSLPALVAGAVLSAASGVGALYRMRRRTSGYPGL
ncbi:hypothetical protein [Streptomyces sp. NPDC001843]|uniref:hypothetical protein n=1 Tax=Streptomyces sp. NPDC001843 TaxID=3364617 RepID=UPI00368D9BBE